MDSGPVFKQSNVTNPDVILFLHGRFGTGEQWRPLISLLGDRYECIAPELPGLGRSSGEQTALASWEEYAVWLRTEITRLQLTGRRIYLVGHDCGGALALLCAAFELQNKTPVHFAGICLLNSMDLTVRLGWWGPSISSLFSRSVSNSPRLTQLKGKEHDDLLAPWRKPGTRKALFRSLRRIYRGWPKAGERSKWTQEIARLKVPILVLRGALDTVNSREMGLDLLKSLPDTLFFEEESCGHWPFIEYPEWVAPKLQTFFFHTKAA